jgi:ligand-binding SRPBCC domain-containing protein
MIWKSRFTGLIVRAGAAKIPAVKTQFVSVSSELPVSAERAFALAQRLETFEFVVSPVIRLALSAEQRAEAEGDDAFRVGAEYSARLWYFKVIPAWTHELKIIAGGPINDGAFEIYTNEKSGPVRVWNHRLTFRPTGDSSCRYTDQIEIPAGVLGLGTKLFVDAFFRYRQRRWLKLLG